MRKLPLCILGFSLLIGTVTVAGQAGDFVVGSGRFADFTVDIMAKSDADGANATGRIRLRSATAFVEAEVTCLAVQGAEAVAGGVIVDATDAGSIGLTLFQVIRENGEGQDANDEASFQVGVIDDPALCANLLGAPAGPIVRGNFEVKDR